MESIETICPTEEELNVIQNRVLCPVDKCGKLFSNPSALKMHLAKIHRITTGLSHNQVYNPHHNTRQHKNDHKGPPKRHYYCPITGCSRSKDSNRPFNRFSQVKQHYLSIHGEKKFHCINCTKSFGMADVCKRHQQLCGKLFQCGTCKKQFNKHALLMHLKRTSHQMSESNNSNYVAHENLRNDNIIEKDSGTGNLKSARYRPILPQPVLKEVNKNGNHELTASEMLFSVETQTEGIDSNCSNRLLVSYGTQTPSLTQIQTYRDEATERLVNKCSMTYLSISDDYVQTTSADVISTCTQTQDRQSASKDVQCNLLGGDAYTEDQTIHFVPQTPQTFNNCCSSTLSGDNNLTVDDIDFNGVTATDKSIYTEPSQSTRNLNYSDIPRHFDVKVQTTLSEYADMIDSGTQTQFSTINVEELQKFLDSIDTVDLEACDKEKGKYGLSNSCHHSLKENLASNQEPYKVDSNFTPLLEHSKEDPVFTVDNGCQTVCNEISLTEAETQTLLSSALDNAINATDFNFNITTKRL
ncbi:uncharacterized protein TRIADDRAFT_55689 [Trichoplax adhaerens]|uniref:C2H2-type domain-containing protein n=1 Tax=Trichoplax adhaerens TaxID=10228 RepID=B3RVK9_TRIAD|nr:hypothetical protein TRIADDRAFT_55689 [Trichoplax adhaerens]EDV26015.1 hypothetical protein TRIADDRAFT_55689 [Trichoplax adhaerens]|eukprot:XP_002112048.1 hypothetical protein TRIADDRAFT_55689 [Trichoplax adhaerens]